MRETWLVKVPIEARDPSYFQGVRDAFEVEDFWYESKEYGLREVMELSDYIKARHLDIFLRDVGSIHKGLGFHRQLREI